MPARQAQLAAPSTHMWMHRRPRFQPSNQSNQPYCVTCKVTPWLVLQQQHLGFGCTTFTAGPHPHDPIASQPAQDSTMPLHTAACSPMKPHQLVLQVTGAHPAWQHQRMMQRQSSSRLLAGSRCRSWQRGRGRQHRWVSSGQSQLAPLLLLRPPTAGSVHACGRYSWSCLQPAQWSPACHPAPPHPITMLLPMPSPTPPASASLLLASLLFLPSARAPPTSCWSSGQLAPPPVPTAPLALPGCR